MNDMTNMMNLNGFAFVMIQDDLTDKQLAHLSHCSFLEPHVLELVAAELQARDLLNKKTPRNRWWIVLCIAAFLIFSFFRPALLPITPATTNTTKRDCIAGWTNWGELSFTSNSSNTNLVPFPHQRKSFINMSINGSTLETVVLPLDGRGPILLPWLLEEFSLLSNNLSQIECRTGNSLLPPAWLLDLHDEKNGTFLETVALCTVSGQQEMTVLEAHGACLWWFVLLIVVSGFVFGRDANGDTISQYRKGYCCIPCVDSATGADVDSGCNELYPLCTNDSHEDLDGVDNVDYVGGRKTRRVRFVCAHHNHPERGTTSEHRPDSFMQSSSLVELRQRGLHAKEITISSEERNAKKHCWHQIHVRTRRRMKEKEFEERKGLDWKGSYEEKEFKLDTRGYYSHPAHHFSDFGTNNQDVALTNVKEVSRACQVNKADVVRTHPVFPPQAHPQLQLPIKSQVSLPTHVEATEKPEDHRDIMSDDNDDTYRVMSDNEDAVAAMPTATRRSPRIARLHRVNYREPKPMRRRTRIYLHRKAKNGTKSYRF